MVAMQVHQLAYQPLGRVQQQQLQVLAAAVQAAAAAITAVAAAAAAAAEQLQQRKLELDQQLTLRKAALAETVETLRVSKP
jgi:hypothetical protein